MTKQWLKKHRVELIIFVFIIFLAAFFRFYQIDQYMTFLGDEGRDALIIKRMLTEGDIPFIGPQSSVGSLYLGPLYYYMMAIPMAIFWMNPVAAAGMVALIGTATVGLIYYLAREWYGGRAAVIASLLYAVSPVTINYSKSSWNPNPTPFFALLGILGLYLAHKKKDYRFLILTGLSAAAALQMHYLAIILLPVFGIIWINELLTRQLNKKESIRHFWLGTVGGIIAFILLMMPLVLFDIKHNYVNYRGFTGLLSGEGSTVGYSPIESLKKILPIYYENYVSRYITAQNKYTAFFVVLLTLMPIVWSIYRKTKKQVTHWPNLVLGIWLGVGLLGVSFYQNNVIDHYLMFLNPVAFLLLGGSAFVFELSQKGISQRISIIALSIFIGSVVSMNIMATPLQTPPNRQLQRTQALAQAVINESAGKPFNFALLAERNYDSAYQFYLDQYGHKPKMLPAEKTDQLFVICEDAVCQPTTNPKYEIAAYGMSKIEWEKEVAGLKLYKLVPNPSGNP